MDDAALKDLILENDEYPCSVLFTNNQLIDFELETPSFHIAIDQLNEQQINRIKIEIRKTQTCLTTIVDMHKSRNVKYVERTMNKLCYSPARLMVTRGG